MHVCVWVRARALLIIKAYLYIIGQWEFEMFDLNPHTHKKNPEFKQTIQEAQTMHSHDTMILVCKCEHAYMKRVTPQDGCNNSNYSPFLNLHMHNEESGPETVPWCKREMTEEKKWALD